MKSRESGEESSESGVVELLDLRSSESVEHSEVFQVGEIDGVQ